MSHTITIALFMVMALLIGNKIGHEAGKATASETCRCDCPVEPMAGHINCTLNPSNCQPGERP